MAFCLFFLGVAHHVQKCRLELRVAPSVVTDALFLGMDIELTFFLTSELKQIEYKECKHYQHYGYRDGCMKRFPYRPNKDNCSPACKDAFNKKESRKKVKLTH